MILKNSSKRYGITFALAMGLMLTACGNEKKVDVYGGEVAEVHNDISNGLGTDVTEGKNVEIIKIESATPSDIGDSCNIVETYDNYNIQVSPQMIVKELVKESYTNFELRTNEVVAADDTNSDDGNYDVIDTVVVGINNEDSYGVLPQKITKKVEYKKEAGSDNWTKTKEDITKWEVDKKKFGGTAWKLTKDDKTTYLRLRDTIEFLNSKLGENASGETVALFDTTILGALAEEKDGEVNLKRIHIKSGTISEDGIITIKMDIDDGELELTLSDFEKIEKAELPFSEEEYKAVADQR